MVRGMGGALALLLSTLCILSAKSAGLNTAYLLPGSATKVDRAALAQTRFCALTFDDGPDGPYTRKTAEILARYNVPATFFVVGSKVAGRPDDVRALAAAGHEIANHSWSHPDFTTLSRAGQQTEIRRCQQQLEKLGLTPRWFRPPYGAFNRGVTKCVQGEGLQSVLWTVDPQDWRQPGADVIERRVLDGSVNGAVILLHSTNAQTVAALPRIIERLQGRGYTFLTMSQWEAAAAGRSVPQLDAPVTLPMFKVPPSLREVTPGDMLPDGGTGVPAGRLYPAPLLALEVAPPSAAVEPAAVEQAADPAWVESVSAELAAATATVAPPSAAANLQASGSEPQPAQQVELLIGPALFIHGNFDNADEAEDILRRPTK